MTILDGSFRLLSLLLVSFRFVSFLFVPQSADSSARKGQITFVKENNFHRNLNKNIIISDSMRQPYFFANLSHLCKKK